MPNGVNSEGDGVELAQLVKRASAGDTDALAMLITRARSKAARAAKASLVRVVRPAIREYIRQYLAQRCSPSMVARWLDELTRNAVVWVLLGLPTLVGEFWPWALTNARNTACMRLRMEHGRRRLKDAQQSSSGGMRG
jgi:hypothetical protein